MNNSFRVTGLVFIVSILFLCFFLLSCSWMNESSDREDIEGLINDEYKAYFFPIDEIDDGGITGEHGQGLLGEKAYLHPWGRKIKRPFDKTIEIEINGNTANVTVICDIEGEFLVDTSDDDIENPGSKPLSDKLIKYAVFEKSDDGRWILTKISPAEIKLADEEKQTVKIISVHIYDTDGDVDMTITDPSTLYDVETEVPHFEKDELVYVEVIAENTTTENYEPRSFVYLHWPYHRDLFYDQGDDTHYFGNWAPHNDGVHHAAVDILNSGCIQNETEDDYNATAWAMPYVVY